jgi:hypothetical protein
LSGPIPRRVEAATKAGLLDLLDEALDSGWTVRRTCGALELPERRAHRWIGRRSRGQLVDKAPGGSRAHGLLPGEEREILALFDEWGETDRSHRKLAHRGSYLGRVWVSPSSVRRVLFLADKHFRPRPRPGKSVKKPFPDWVEYKPNCIWIYDTTHFPAAGTAVLIIEDLVSRKWLTEIVRARRPPPRSSSRSPTLSKPRGCSRPSMPATATTAGSTSALMTSLARSCSPCPTTAHR